LRKTICPTGWKRQLPSLEKCVDLGPAVKHHGDPIRFEHPIGLTHGRLEPVSVRIVLDGAAAAIAIVHQVLCTTKSTFYG
jgi:hypothetical protein